MKKFLEPEITILNFIEEIVLTDSTTPTEGGGRTGIGITNEF